MPDKTWNNFRWATTCTDCIEPCKATHPRKECELKKTSDIGMEWIAFCHRAGFTNAGEVEVVS